ncbi:MAG: hypothetical protein V7K25_11860 [Nostoc sp.]|uniref:hypothetical protein n=1 Tax=Nostoc sp. TaxID=1180 RepID=UPI002FF74332
MLKNKHILIPTLLIAVLANVSVIFLSEYQRFRDKQEQAIIDKQKAEILIKLLKADAKRLQEEEQNRREVSAMLTKRAEQIVADSTKEQQEFSKVLRDNQVKLDLKPLQPLNREGLVQP